MSASESDDVQAPARKKLKTGTGRPARATASKKSLAESDAEDREEEKPKPKRGRAKKEDDGEVKPVKQKKAGKTQADDAVLPPRVQGAWKIGAHVSAAGGVENAVLNAAKIGASAFALFLKSQRKWVSPAYKQSNIDAFKAAMTKHGYTANDVLPHGSYLLNLGNPDTAKRAQSYTCFIDDLKRAEQLGLLLYNLHPGSTVGACERSESIKLIAHEINRAHKETSSVVVVLENMAGQGNVVGNKFEDLRDIIAQVDNKERVGVCIDTCHMFAAGYDIRTREAYDKTMSEFDNIVGAKYLRGMHINDSMGGLACSKDRHANLGLGELGLRTFAHVVSDARTRGIPLVLETPADDDTEIWAVEVAALAELAGHTAVEDVSAAAGFESSGTGAGSDAGKRYEVSDEILDGLAAKIKAAAARSNKPKEKKTKAKKPAAKRKRGKKDEDEDEDEDDDE